MIQLVWALWSVKDPPKNKRSDSFTIRQVPLWVIYVSFNHLLIQKLVEYLLGFKCSIKHWKYKDEQDRFGACTHGACIREKRGEKDQQTKIQT